MLALAPGTRLGPYEVTAFIGRGGMGEVYRARDTKLHRDVALKVLPDLFASDPERLARFQREAQILASLNHPNIAAIHGLEEANGATALVLELIEGPTVADRIAQGPIPLDDALPISKQIAEALEAAHDHGIIHRDLKPANIKVRPDGTVKILDFGLAKAFSTDPLASPTALSDSPTITSPAALTGAGVILGTAAYMSPEQAKGKVADKRSDIWAFGCVLYEMLTGRRAFGGATLIDTLAAIVGSDVDWAVLPAETPAGIRQLLRRCLAKERRQRLSDAAAARLDIEDALAAPAAARLAAAPDRTARVWRIVAALAILSTLIVLSLRVADWETTRPPPVRLTRLSIVLPASAPLRPDVSLRGLAISSDGTQLVYVSTPGTLVVRALDRLEPRTIAGVGEAIHPVFSPDGQWIAFFDGTSLKKVPTAGGPVHTVAQLSATPTGLSWGPNDVIVFSVSGEERSGLLKVSAAGGVPEMLTTPDVSTGAFHHWPEMLPDGEAVLFQIVGAATGDVGLLDLRTRSWRVLVPNGSDAHYVAPGYLIYASGGALFAARFDLTRKALTSAAVPVGVDHFRPVAIGSHVSIAREGTVIYIPEPPPSTLAWVDRQNRREPLGAPPRRYIGVRLSPDATRAVLTLEDGYDLWMWDLGRRSLTRLTVGNFLDVNPTWTPDGTRLVWTSGRNTVGGVDLFTQSADGTGSAEQLTQSKNVQMALDITPDGRHLVVGLTGPRTALDLTLLPLNPTGPMTSLLAAPIDERHGKVSPDGRWLAYDSNENGRFEIFVRPFPDVDTAKWQVSTGGGTQPLWARSGRELFFRSADGSVVSVSVQADGRQFRRGTPATLIAGSSFLTETMSFLPQQTYDVHPDGSRFLMIQEGESSTTSSPIIVVHNLLEEVKARISTK